MNKITNLINNFKDVPDSLWVNDHECYVCGKKTCRVWDMITDPGTSIRTTSIGVCGTCQQIVDDTKLRIKKMESLIK